VLAPRSVPEIGLAASIGLVAGALGSYAQQLSVGPLELPLGVLLGGLLVAAVAVSVRVGLRTRLGSTALALGWFVAVVLASSPRREGDVLVAGDARGWGFLVAGTLVLALALAVPRRRPDEGMR